MIVIPTCANFLLAAINGYSLIYTLIAGNLIWLLNDYSFVTKITA